MLSIILLQCRVATCWSWSNYIICSKDEKSPAAIIFSTKMWLLSKLTIVLLCYCFNNDIKKIRF